jgi:wobble nucleotide-excising tRNase
VDCPYCGQNIGGNELIKAYRTYFNVAYDELKKKVVVLARGVEARVGDQVAEEFAAAVKHNQSISEGWADHVSVPVFSFDKDITLATLGELRTLLSGLALAKQQSPLEVVGNEADKTKAAVIWEQIINSVRVCNKSLADFAQKINAFKTQLASENIVQLQQQIARLKLTKTRHQQVVVALIDQWNAAKNDKALADKEKTTARNSLDALMKQILHDYQDAINALLKKFAASFEIAKMDSNYLGGEVRTEYGLRLRGKDVKLSGGSPSFETVLSEGDKRTLAFAFFIAAVQSDPELANSIVVIDDPMCSLDRNRKRHTCQVLKEIGGVAKQLIVLGHDLYFLRDLRDELTPHSGQAKISLIKLVRSLNDYTNFDKLDIDRECEADYYQHHRALTEFVEGKNVSDTRAVAKSIRPMLEGYLHRRFPRRIRRGALFGNIVTEAKTANLPDPLAHLQPLTQELNEINSYAGQFHHDTNAAADSVAIVDAELKLFADRALTVVHKGVP